MKNTLSISYRAVIATAVCATLLFYPLLRVSGSATTPRIEVKSETQFRSEAALFTRALNAVSAIATMKLDTGDDLKKALSILDRERANLKFQRSKLVSTALDDSTLIGAVKKRATDQKSAEALIRELEADPRTVLKLEGADALRIRLQRSAEADATVLRSVAERLKAVADKLTKASQGRASTDHDFTSHDWKISKVNFWSQPAPPETLFVFEPGTIILLIIITGVACAVIGYVAGRMSNYLDLRDDIEECQGDADRRLEACLKNSADLPSGFPFFQKEAATALCYSEWLARHAGCLVAG